MTKFKYRVRNRQGKVVQGTLEADHKNLVISNLLNQGFYILSLQEVNQSGVDLKLNFGIRGVSTRDLVVFTRQLATMLSAGLSILRCFSILEQQTVNKRLKAAIQVIGEDIEAGQAFWEALAKYPKIFSPVYISMIRAGELGGILDDVLERLGDHLEREQEINSKIKSASIYPAIITLFAVLMVFFILTFVMPTFVGMFQAAGVDLPRPTRILLALSTTLQARWILVLGTIGLLIFLMKQWGKSSSGRWFYDCFYLHIPVVGKTISRVTVARFSRTMGTLVRSGIPVLQALEVVENVVGNAVIAQGIKNARLSIREGDSISGPLVETGVFEPMVTQMIAVGEETGSLDDMLIRMSDYFDREVMYMIDAMMAVVEPVLIMLVALLVGGIVVATLMPIFNMMSLVGT